MSIKKQEDTKQVVKGNTIKQSVVDYVVTVILTLVQDKRTTISTKKRRVFPPFFPSVSQIFRLSKLILRFRLGSDSKHETLRKL